ncbi:hypothetical protein BOVMAS25_17230 [Streptococcus uberis]
MLALVILSTIMLSISRILIAQISRSKSFGENYGKWISENDKKLKFGDEILSFASLLFSIYITMLISHEIQHFSFITAIIVVSLIYCNIAWIGIVFIIGNIIYPVNGIETVKNDRLSVSVLQVYSRMHFSELALGLLTISLAYTSSIELIKYMGCIVGILQMISTYYSQPIKYKFYIFSIILWNIWIVFFQLTNTFIIQLF